MKFLKGLCDMIEKLFREFINIYDDEGVRETYGDSFADRLAGVNPETGERKISVKKILFRIVIITIILLFTLLVIRINTNVSFWGTR